MKASHDTSCIMKVMMQYDFAQHINEAISWSYQSDTTKKISVPIYIKLLPPTPLLVSSKAIRALVFTPTKKQLTANCHRIQLLGIAKCLYSCGQTKKTFFCTEMFMLDCKNISLQLDTKYRGDWKQLQNNHKSILLDIVLDKDNVTDFGDLSQSQPFGKFQMHWASLILSTATLHINRNVPSNCRRKRRLKCLPEKGNISLYNEYAIQDSNSREFYCESDWESELMRRNKTLVHASGHASGHAAAVTAKYTENYNYGKFCHVTSCKQAHSVHKRVTNHKN